jgi:hypothetical protein
LLAGASRFASLHKEGPVDPLRGFSHREEEFASSGGFVGEACHALSGGTSIAELATDPGNRVDFGRRAKTNLQRSPCLVGDSKAQAKELRLLWSRLASYCETKTVEGFVAPLGRIRVAKDRRKKMLQGALQFLEVFGLYDLLPFREVGQDGTETTTSYFFRFGDHVPRAG